MLARNSKLLCGICKNSAVRARGFAVVAGTKSNSAATSPYKHGKFRSDAQVNILKVPVIEVDGHLAVCEGGGGSLGHPIEYIQLDTVNSDGPVACVYCGLRYQSKGHH